MSIEGEEFHEMRRPEIEKVVVHMGIGQGGRELQNAEQILTEITGQDPVRTTAKSAIREFEIRQGDPIGTKVTLRGETAEEFLLVSPFGRKASQWRFDESAVPDYHRTRKGHPDVIAAKEAGYESALETAAECLDAVDEAEPHLPDDAYEYFRFKLEENEFHLRAMSEMQLAWLKASNRIYYEGTDRAWPDATAEMRGHLATLETLCDRYDESYDMIRVVRGQRYKYVRNYYSGQPYRQWIPFRNNHPAMRDLLQRDAAGELQGAESWVGERRPAEELYDLQADPHETENLIDDSDHADARERLRGALDDWLDRIDDYATEDEAAMARHRHLGDGEPITATPTFVPNAPGNRERETTPDGADLESPATVSIHCSTQGASVGYTTETGADPDWQLYTGPISLVPGETTLRAKAVRYGFEESDEREATFTVSD